MPEITHLAPEGPFAGSRCVAGPGGRWGFATVRACHGDGTFKIEFDIKEMIVMPFWYGVTASELSFDDLGQWSGVFARLSPDGERFGRADFGRALTMLGYGVDESQAHGYWKAACDKAFGTPEERAESLALDREAAWKLFLALGLSAKTCAEKLQPGPADAPFKLYWNQTRMGGRDPFDLARPVTLGDAFTAIGIDASLEDSAAVQIIAAFEAQNAIALPRTLRDTMTRKGVADAVTHSHCNNPNLVPLAEWTLERGTRGPALDGDFALTIMLPHQGDHEWVAVFDAGDDDARIYVRWPGEDIDGDIWRSSAAGVGMFFWDLAQTGLGWSQEFPMDEGRSIRSTDIGLAYGE